MISVWTARTRVVARLGLERILRRIFQLQLGVGPFTGAALAGVSGVDVLLVAR